MITSKKTALAIGCAVVAGSIGIGSAAMIHVALATTGVTAEQYPCDIIGPLFYDDDVLTEPLQIGDGIARAIGQPGLGVELDESKVEKYRVR